ncbi:hypothetical protein ABMA28_007372 [Loxostege sticticalis]|uniref:Reverse transcriptase domain-containing protein n=1 Tax=Loxostege sticticalis TaxID=481309 RepID=A0ABD0TQU8_LOXSC
MGDFNTCLLKNDSRSTRLRSLISSCNLNILPLKATHFFPNCAPSLLDLMIVSSTDHVAKHGQCHADAFSYHDLIYLSYKIRPPKSKAKFLLQRNFSGMNVDALKQDAATTDWSVIEHSENVDDKVALFNSLLLNLYDKHAPIRPVKIKHVPAPWLTDELKSLRNKKHSAKTKFKMDPSDKNREKYKLIRNRCNTLCRDAQRRHIHNSVKNGDPAKVWRFLKSIGVGRTRNDSVSKDINIDLLNKHFSTSVAVDGTTKNNTLTHLSSLPTPDYPPFNFSQVSDCDVERYTLSIASNAVGSDCVSRNMIIPLLDILTPVISHILNYSLSSGVFPTIWKDAQVVPLPKKAKPSSYADYRPISILPFLSKVMERVVHHQFSHFLSANQLLNPFQSGFRPGHSTTTALVKITDDIRLGMDSKQLTVLALLDFSNAFNSVDFDILHGLLRSLNMSPTVLDWFHSYLHGRRQRIRSEDLFSAWCDLTSGVPQGGVLSPLLFAIFINSITHNLTSSFHLYADDLQIYSQGRLEDLSSVVEIVNHDLGRILDWSKSFGLKVNPTKTQVIIVGSSRQIARIDWPALQPITFDGVQIPFSSTVKNLGIYMDSALTWTTQIAEVSRKIFAAAASLNRLKHFLPIPTKIALVQALLFPILDYADCCYLDLTEILLDKLERLQNYCIRLVYAPPYLKERFQFLQPSHGHDMRTNPTKGNLWFSNSRIMYRTDATTCKYFLIRLLICEIVLILNLIAIAQRLSYYTAGTVIDFNELIGLYLNLHLWGSYFFLTNSMLVPYKKLLHLSCRITPFKDYSLFCNTLYT